MTQKNRSSLSDRLARRIARLGPMTLADFMATVLTDAQDGFYAARGQRSDPFGKSGDFVTAPEISQMFGELIGLWCVTQWHALRRPAPFNLVELGPGRGTLLADALRAARLDPAFLAALRLQLVEISPDLQAHQAARLAAWPARWHRSVAELPPGPSLVVANEFFDALPLRQFERQDAGWAERLVTLCPDGTLALSPAPPDPAVAHVIPPHLAALGTGSVAEVSTVAQAICADLVGRLITDSGALLVIDYGAARPPGEATLQAVRRHRPEDIFAHPGLADLSAHVDFDALAAVARDAGAVVHGPVSQGAFLRALGIEARAERLSAQAAPPQETEIRQALERLTAPEAMGSLFKVMAVSAPGLDPPAGFV